MVGQERTNTLYHQTDLLRVVFIKLAVISRIPQRGP
jgi:hypothetical protein